MTTSGYVVRIRPRKPPSRWPVILGILAVLTVVVGAISFALYTAFRNPATNTSPNAKAAKLAPEAPKPPVERDVPRRPTPIPEDKKAPTPEEIQAAEDALDAKEMATRIGQLDEGTVEAARLALIRAERAGAKAQVSDIEEAAVISPRKAARIARLRGERLKKQYNLPE